jgi:heptosyltransferase-2
VNEVLVFNPDAPYAVRWFRMARAWRLALTRLWRRRFDTALLPRWDADVGHASYVAYLSGAPVRVGYSETVSEFRRAENAGYDRLLSKPLPDATLKHEVEHNLDVLRAVGGTVENDRFEIWLKPEDESFAEKALTRLQSKQAGPLVAFGLGCRESHRQWPVERFSEVAHWLVSTERARLVCLPGPREEPLAEQWRMQLDAASVEVIKNTSLRQAAAILKQCNLFVGNDSSLKHLAVAMGVPCVEIFSFPPSPSPDATQGTPASRFHAWGVPHRTVTPREPRPPCTTSCRAGEPHCILGISVSDVQNACRELLSEYRQKSPSG